MEEQGYKTEPVLYQDIHSAMLLENDGPELKQKNPTSQHLLLFYHRSTQKETVGSEVLSN